MCFSDTFWHNFAVPPYDDDEAERSSLSAHSTSSWCQCCLEKDGKGWYGFLVVFLLILPKYLFQKRLALGIAMASSCHGNVHSISHPGVLTFAISIAIRTTTTLVTHLLARTRMMHCCMGKNFMKESYLELSPTSFRCRSIESLEKS